MADKKLEKRQEVLQKAVDAAVIDPTKADLPPGFERDAQELAAIINRRHPARAQREFAATGRSCLTD